MSDLLPFGEDRPVNTGNARIDAMFAEFHAEHPEVYEMFVRFSRELLAAGRDRGSAEQIVQRIRWETALNPNHDAGFKINNWFRARYARLLAKDDARFVDFFEFRYPRAEGEAA